MKQKCCKVKITVLFAHYVRHTSRCITVRFLNFRNRDRGPAMAEITAPLLAKYIISVRHACGDKITQLKLQKLIYYVQAWHLGLYGREIFREEIEAWVHGPVVPSVRAMYRDHRWSPLPAPESIPELPLTIQAHVKKVLAVYGGLSASDLEAISHTEDPWITARSNKSPKEPSSAVISKAHMKNYFSRAASGSF